MPDNNAYRVKTQQELDGERNFSEAQARIDSGDKPGGIKLLIKARDLFSSCHSPKAQAKAYEVQELLSILSE